MLMMMMCGERFVVQITPNKTSFSGADFKFSSEFFREHTQDTQDPTKLPPLCLYKTEKHTIAYVHH